jgi:hypothetical protein
MGIKLPLFHLLVESLNSENDSGFQGYKVSEGALHEFQTN